MIEEKELRSISQMLKSTYEMARDTKMMSHGHDELKAGAGVRQYNAVVNRLEETDTIPKGIFTPLKEDDSLEALGVCCTQLSSYLKGMMGQPDEEKSTGRRVKVTTPSINMIGGIPDMENIGELIRQAMPSWLREQMDKEKPKAEEKENETPKAEMSDLESQMAELGAQMQSLAEQMQKEGLSNDEIRNLASQMRELGKQQANMRSSGDADESPE